YHRLPPRLLALHPGRHPADGPPPDRQLGADARAVALLRLESVTPAVTDRRARDAAPDRAGAPGPLFLPRASWTTPLSSPAPGHAPRAASGGRSSSSSSSWSACRRGPSGPPSPPSS